MGAPMHGFPHPERNAELFDSWQSIVGHKVKETDPLKIYKNKKICDYHFTPEQKVACHRLIYKAVPSVNFEGVFISPSSINIEHNYCLPNIGIKENLLQQNNEDISERLHPAEVPSSSKTASDTGHKSSQFLHKESKSAQKEIRSLKNKLRKSVKQARHYKARLATVSNLLHGSDDMARFTKNMSRSGRIFTGMQYRQASKKPKGRRYNMEEKVLALSIFKKSPKCYNLLY
ncbi:uncharacterized protein LOC125238954 [Leguminivora glycinivorella]|uniref:uncharacterized protein LOC125238954 n=1 Tax=Leguminivora glycinivorella TaxID=1035111 RepID=UPI0020106CA3|nr:uncharacterized protein LOC125238954 [Leguminivora glycinivorella]